MKLQPGRMYRNKITGKKVRIESIEGRNITFTQIGVPNGFRTTSIRDFGMKHKEL